MPFDAATCPAVCIVANLFSNVGYTLLTTDKLPRDSSLPEMVHSARFGQLNNNRSLSNTWQLH
uniref:Uncharacterized protein n=1 Tax=Romanomermis culicivorax TaxID=13658 RepID=A0A915JEN0_ROMCU